MGWAPQAISSNGDPFFLVLLVPAEQPRLGGTKQYDIYIKGAVKKEPLAMELQGKLWPWKRVGRVCWETARIS